jgi:hypothetical protein
VQFVILAGTEKVAIRGRDRLVAEVVVGGLSLLGRAARAAPDAGADRLLVLAPARLCDAVRRDGRIRIPVDCRPTEDPRQILVSVREELDERFWIAPADRVVSPGLFPPDAGDGPCLVTDEGGAPVGTILATRDSLETLAGADLHELVASGRMRSVAAAPRSPWAPVRSESDWRAARRMLFAALRKPLGHDSDGIVAYTINRPISLSMTRVLVHTPVTPNQVSAAALALGLVAAGLVATGRWPFLVAGGLVLQLASILDGVDGEIARLKPVTSRGGEWFDTVCDDVTSIVFFAGTGLACHARNAAWALPATIAGVAGWIVLDAAPRTHDRRSPASGWRTCVHNDGRIQSGPQWAPPAAPAAGPCCRRSARSPRAEPAPADARGPGARRARAPAARPGPCGWPRRSRRCDPDSIARYLRHIGEPTEPPPLAPPRGPPYDQSRVLWRGLPARQPKQQEMFVQ